MFINKALLYGIATGSLIGGIFTLLNAPKSGSEMRSSTREIQKNLSNSIHTLQKDGLVLVDQVKETSKESSTIIKEVANDLQVSVNRWKQDVVIGQNNIQNNLKDIQKTMEVLENKITRA